MKRYPASIDNVCAEQVRFAFIADNDFSLNTETRAVLEETIKRFSRFTWHYESIKIWPNFVFDSFAADNHSFKTFKCPLTVEVVLNEEYFECTGAYMLLNNCNITSALNALKSNDTYIESYVDEVAKHFKCAIEHRLEYYLADFQYKDYFQREIWMFDGRKVLEEETEFNYVSGMSEPKNPEYDTRRFADVIEAEYEQSCIDCDLAAT